jgi:hypothetical protein
LHGVGGSVHPDELLGRLSARQWQEWRTYCQLYSTPMQRADANAALIQLRLGQWKKTPALSDLMPLYGKRRVQTSNQIMALAKAWAGV